MEKRIYWAWILIFLCCQGPGLLSAQSAVDSLNAIWENAQLADSQRIKARMNFISSEYLRSRPDTALSLLLALDKKYNSALPAPYHISLSGDISRAYAYLGQYNEGYEWARKMLEQAQAAGNQRLEAGARKNVGALLFELGDTEGSLNFLKESLMQFEAIPDSSGMALCLGNLGNVYSRLSQFERSLEVNRRAARILQAIKDSISWAGVVGNTGNTFAYLGQYDSALQYMRQGLSIFEGMGDLRGAGAVSSGIGGMALLIGEVDSARYYYERSVESYRQVGFMGGQAYSMTAMGNIMQTTGDYAQAIAYYEQGLGLFRQSGDVSGESTALIGIGDVYRLQEDVNQAMEYFQAVLELREGIENPWQIAEVLTRIGQVYSKMGNDSLALATYTRSLALNDSIGHKRGYANDLANIGSWYKDRKEYEPALQYLEESLPLQRQLGNVVAEASVLMELADIAFIKGEVEKAGELARLGLAAVAKSQETQVERKLSYTMYQVLKVQNRSGEALRMHERYIMLNDSLERTENKRAAIRFEFSQQALQDSLAFTQREADTKLAFQQRLSRRNYGLIATIALALIGFLFFRNRQRLRAEQQELALQRERERKAQLEELDQLKTRFFTNISHEFRTPLTVILGLAGQLPAAQAQMSSLIRRNGQRLLRLINQILDLSRLEAQTLPIHLQKGDIMAYIRFVAASFEALARDRAIELKIELPEAPLVMDFDPERLQDVLYNLLSNALKFTPEGGTVSLSAAISEGMVAVSVADTGPGIPPSELPHIFDRFFQGHAIAREGSSGIGLALVKGLLHQMGGDIQAESQAGTGSRFTFHLPIQDAEMLPKLEPLEQVDTSIEAISTAVPTPAPDEVDSDRPRVLVVEDNPDIVTYLAGMLGSDYQVLTAANGADGVQTAQEQVPDIIISDVMMPEMDGFELTRLVKTDTRTSHIPVILLTAKARQADKISGLQYGADAYLTKPFDQQELLVRIHNLLSIRTQLQHYYQGATAANKGQRLPKPGLSELDRAFMHTVQTTIQEHLTNPELSIHTLCDALHLARTQVYRKIKALTGQTPTLYIRSLRLQKAYKLLAESELSVSEVAYDTGFSDPGYFSRVFAQEFGQRPTSLR